MQAFETEPRRFADVPYFHLVLKTCEDVGFSVIFSTTHQLALHGTFTRLRKTLQQINANANKLRDTLQYLML